MHIFVHHTFSCRLKLQLACDGNWKYHVSWQQPNFGHWYTGCNEGCWNSLYPERCYLCVDYCCVDVPDCEQLVNVYISCICMPAFCFCDSTFWCVNNVCRSCIDRAVVSFLSSKSLLACAAIRCSTCHNKSSNSSYLYTILFSIEHIIFVSHLDWHGENKTVYCRSCVFSFFTLAYSVFVI